MFPVKCRWKTRDYQLANSSHKLLLIKEALKYIIQLLKEQFSVARASILHLPLYLQSGTEHCRWALVWHLSLLGAFPASLLLRSAITGYNRHAVRILYIIGTGMYRTCRCSAWLKIEDSLVLEFTKSTWPLWPWGAFHNPGNWIRLISGDNDITPRPEDVLAAQSDHSSPQAASHSPPVGYCWLIINIISRFLSIYPDFYTCNNLIYLGRMVWAPVSKYLMSIIWTLNVIPYKNVSLKINLVPWNWIRSGEESVHFWGSQWS